MLPTTKISLDAKNAIRLSEIRRSDLPDFVQHLNDRDIYLAPRPVYVASGIEDTWADPRGEYASAFHGSKVYELFGKQGLKSEKLPPLGEPILQSNVGYHVREGGHSVELYDWRRFMDFADIHLKPKK